jgi:hypothetical protein
MKYKHPNLRRTPAIQGGGGDPYWNNVVRLYNADQTLGNVDAICQKTGNILTQAGGLEEVVVATKYSSGGSYYAPTVSGGTLEGWKKNLGSGESPSDSNLDLRDIDWTIEAWVNPQNTLSTTRGIFTLASSSELAISLRISNMNLRLFLNNFNWVSSSAKLGANAWSHVAAVRFGITVKIFINGVEAGSVTDANANASFSGGTGEWGENLCAVNLNSVSIRNPFGGYIDELRITKGVARYTANFTPPTTKFPTN